MNNVRAGHRAQLQQSVKYGNQYRTSDCVVCGEQAGNVINHNGTSVTISLHRLGLVRTEYNWVKSSILLHAAKDKICNICCSKTLDELIQNGIRRECNERIVDNFSGNKRLIDNMHAFLTAPSLKKVILSQQTQQLQQQQHAQQSTKQRLVAATVNDKQCETLTNMSLNQLDGIATFTLQQMTKRHASYGTVASLIDAQPVSDKQIMPVIVDRNDEDDEKNGVYDDEDDEDVSVGITFSKKDIQRFFSKLCLV